jgi:LmbE family N-acetylglucosaminyl deacetylase
MKNPYHAFVSDYVQWLKHGAKCPLGKVALPRQPKVAADAPKALMFSPHPDDECIIGGLALRLRRELHWNVVNVAVTQGSKKERQPGRWEELKNACAYLGFGLVRTREGGLEKINPKGRESDAANWVAASSVVTGLINCEKPRVIFMPHAQDWNSTHIGTNLLVTEALKELGRAFTCYVVETEFWGAMTTPNLMIESSPRDVADLVTATSFHVGEVRRNPYHIGLPAWMQDNVRRGAEIVGGQGGEAPKFTFATLYRLQRWTGGKLEKVFDDGRLVSRKDDLKKLFA